MAKTSRKTVKKGDATGHVSTRRSSEFSVEELSSDDIGYDADIEVVQPEYEDAESGNDEETRDDEGYESVDSEGQLAHRLRGLYCDPSMASSEMSVSQQSPRKGKKRMSKDMVEGTTNGLPRMARSDLEIMELSVHTDDIQPAKRQRKRLARSKTGERIVRLISKDRAENESRSGADSSTLASSPSPVEQPASPEPDMMDVT
jgi:hypothetical protein